MELKILLNILDLMILKYEDLFLNQEILNFMTMHNNSYEIKDIEEKFNKFQEHINDIKIM